eukprot:scaffold1026_cov409-Prasinococcus_capsulatus_cf.AAC.5
MEEGEKGRVFAALRLRERHSSPPLRRPRAGGRAPPCGDDSSRSNISVHHWPGKTPGAWAGLGRATRAVRSTKQGPGPSGPAGPHEYVSIFTQAGAGVGNHAIRRLERPYEYTCWRGHRLAAGARWPLRAKTRAAPKLNVSAWVEVGVGKGDSVTTMVGRVVPWQTSPQRMGMPLHVDGARGWGPAVPND